MKHYFVLNPNASKAAPRHMAERIRAACSSARADFELYETKSKEDTAAYVRERTRGAPCRVYAVGGDGTLNDVLNGIGNLETTELGSFPCGTGNDFAKSLPSTIEALLDPAAQLAAKAFPVDLITVNGMRCINTVSIGVDANTAFLMQRIKRIPFLNRASYALALGISAIRPLKYQMDVRFPDGQEVRGPFALAVFASGQYYGGSFRAAPTARPDDGHITACLVKPISKLKFLRLVGDYKKGAHVGAPEFAPILTYRTTGSARVTSKQPMRVCLDGEMLVTAEADIVLHPGAIRFALPGVSGAAHEEEEVL
ncbi:hypothetical protein LJC34_07375 [Oscillospiraceae bacterium OttesenSCG-928-G22]|nr:hypothetical protein [Oscillospiraceae bacterium OttesenSCG-928-G22]